MSFISKGSGGNFFSSLLEQSALEEELGAAKAFVKGANKFEISESDTLNEKERLLNQDLNAGAYRLEIFSMGTGKFSVQVTVKKNGKETLFALQKVLSGRGKNSSAFGEFIVPKEMEPVSFDMIFKDKAAFWQKSSYSFKLWRTLEPTTPQITPIPVQPYNDISPISGSFIGMPHLYPQHQQPLVQQQLQQPQTPVPLGISPSTMNISSGKVKIKLVVNEETRYMIVDLHTLYEDLKARITEEYGDKVMKYTDQENEIVTIKNQHDLEQFFENVSKEKTPKLILADKLQTINTHPGLPRNRSESVDYGNNQRSESGSPIMSSPLSAGHVSKTRHVSKWAKGAFLGAGAFGKVYLGMNEENGQLMAIKEFEIKHLSVDSEYFKSLEHEIALMAELDHENIVRYLGTQRTKDYLYIFLDYIPGGSLERILGFFPLVERVIRIYTLQILKGLKYLHQNGVIHRDIKAGNILIDENGKIYLADFGCSKKVAGMMGQAKTITGTPNYIAPEVIIDQHYTPAADIWSLGCTIIEMFTRRPPWHNELHKFETAFAFFEWLTKEKPQIEYPKNASEQALDFMARCLEKDHHKRATIDELLMHPFVTQPAPENDGAEDIATTPQDSEASSLASGGHENSSSSNCDEESRDIFADDLPDEYHSDDEGKEEEEEDVVAEAVDLDDISKQVQQDEKSPQQQHNQPVAEGKTTLGGSGKFKTMNAPANKSLHSKQSFKFGQKSMSFANKTLSSEHAIEKFLKKSAAIQRSLVIDMSKKQ